MSFPIVAQSSVVILQESRRGEYSKTLYTILLFCLDSLQWKKGEKIISNVYCERHPNTDNKLLM